MTLFDTKTHSKCQLHTDYQMIALTPSPLLLFLSEKCGSYSKNLDIQSLLKGIRPEKHHIAKDLRQHEEAAMKLEENNLPSNIRLKIQGNLLTHESVYNILIWKMKSRNKHNHRDR